MIAHARARIIGGGLPTGAGDGRYIRRDGGNSPTADIDWDDNQIVGLAGLDPETDGAADGGNAILGWRRFFLNAVQPVGGGFVIEDDAGVDGFRVTASEAIVNQGGVDRDFRVEGDTDQNLIFGEGGTDRVGIGTDSPAAKLDVTQGSVTGAIPVLDMDQRDLSEEFIMFTTTIGVGNPIEAVGAKTLTVTHFARVSIIGVAGPTYAALGTIA